MLRSMPERRVGVHILDCPLLRPAGGQRERQAGASSRMKRFELNIECRRVLLKSFKHDLEG